MKSLLKKITQSFGYDILHLPTDPIVRKRIDLFTQSNINLLFDIGANTGQFAKRMRQQGYKGKIVSFEPLPDAFQALQTAAAHDPNWEVLNCAIGNYDGKASINVSQNSYSSSILLILPKHIESAPESAYVKSIDVEIKKIDSIIQLYHKPESKLFLKIDTQGFEKQVFEGCLNSLEKIQGFQMELSLIPLYEGETLMQEMIDYLKNYGYLLKLMEGGHQNYDSGEILQVEGYFFK